MCFKILRTKLKSWSQAKRREKQIEYDKSLKADKKCPKCLKKDQVVKIIYGYPGPELGEAERRGKIMLGGCVIEEDHPEYYCKKCHRGFGRLGNTTFFEEQ